MTTIKRLFVIAIALTTTSIEKRVAEAGHDTEKFNASDATYSKLPDCCHYPRKS